MANDSFNCGGCLHNKGSTLELMIAKGLNMPKVSVTDVTLWSFLCSPCTQMSKPRLCQSVTSLKTPVNYLFRSGFLKHWMVYGLNTFVICCYLHDPSGRLGLVYFLFHSELNKEKQRSVFMLHISGTKSLKSQRPSAPLNPDLRLFCLLLPLIEPDWRKSINVFISLLHFISLIYSISWFLILFHVKITVLNFF